MINTKEVDSGRIEFFWGNNNKHLGYAYQEVDGFYVFQFEDNNGCWSDYSLKAISDKLFELNKNWNEHLKKEGII